MRIDRKPFWAVRDPTPHSEIGDVLMRFSSFSEYNKLVVGLNVTPGGLRELDRFAYYDDEGEARADAEKRLEGRRLMNEAFAGSMVFRGLPGALR